MPALLLLTVVAAIGLIVFVMFVSAEAKTDIVQQRMTTLFGDDRRPRCEKCGDHQACDSPYCGFKEKEN